MDALALKNIRKELRHIATVPVYFARAQRQGQIKIGFSTDVRNRLHLLGYQRFTTMDLLGWVRGGPAVERKMHQRFAEFSLGREWFEAAPELLDFIAAHTRHDEPPQILSKYGRITDWGFNSLLADEKLYASRVEGALTTK